MEEDIEHLHWLSIFHYIAAGILALVGCFPIIHLVIGIALLAGGLQGNHGNGPPAFFGAFFAGVALMMIVMMWSLAIALFAAGRRLKKHVDYTFCLIVAAVECIFFPIGTVLGVFTIIVLMRPSVKTLFGADSARAASS